jgi:hypothetical protein
VPLFCAQAGHKFVFFFAGNYPGVIDRAPKDFSGSQFFFLSFSLSRPHRSSPNKDGALDPFPNV